MSCALADSLIQLYLFIYFSYIVLFTRGSLPLVSLVEQAQKWRAPSIDARRCRGQEAYASASWLELSVVSVGNIHMGVGHKPF